MSAPVLRSPAAADAAQRCALVRALWAHVQARDWAAMRAAFADEAVMHWPLTGERLHGADLIVRVNAEYPEGWRIELRSVDALADGRVLAQLEVPHGDRRFFAQGVYTFSGTRIAAATEYWAMRELPPPWRTAARFGPGLTQECIDP
jgi:hypothetical protein